MSRSKKRVRLTNTGRKRMVPLPSPPMFVCHGLNGMEVIFMPTSEDGPTPFTQKTYKLVGGQLVASEG